MARHEFRVRGSQGLGFRGFRPQRVQGLEDLGFRELGFRVWG